MSSKRFVLVERETNRSQSTPNGMRRLAGANSLEELRDRLAEMTGSRPQEVTDGGER
jgi:hypothetical protein